MKLNHVNLPSLDIQADRAMFERYFGLRCLAARGKGLVVMEDGRIVEEGSHTELLKRGGLYAQLWRRQSGGFLAREAAE